MFARGGGVQAALSPWGNQVRVRAVCQSTAWNLGALADGGELGNLSNFVRLKKCTERGCSHLETAVPLPVPAVRDGE